MISVACTTYNRYQMTIDSFAQIIDHPFISEFVILDDVSIDGSFEKLREYFKDNPNVKVWRQQQNVGMSKNKANAIFMCKEDFVLIADSDNTFSKQSIDSLMNIDFDYDTIYCPSFAMPSFDYRQFAGLEFEKSNIAELIKDSMGNCCMNTANYVVPKWEYLDTYKFNPEHKASDTVYMNYLWLMAGKKFKIVEGFEYQHLQHPGSGFLQDLDYNMKKAEEVRKLILAL